MRLKDNGCVILDYYLSWFLALVVWITGFALISVVSCANSSALHSAIMEDFRHHGDKKINASNITHGPSSVNKTINSNLTKFVILNKNSSYPRNNKFSEIYNRDNLHINDIFFPTNNKSINIDKLMTKTNQNSNIVLIDNNNYINDENSLIMNNSSVSSISDIIVNRSIVRRDSLFLHEEDPCLTFTVGDPDNKILYSPGYPGHYPKKANCFVILEAPPGHLLRLDFRDHFDVEPSDDCKFDFLEIRDGMYGFSTQIGQYCGQEFPPMVTSRDRHLWLHFQSDENIEYSGFKMVYEYIMRPTTSMQPELETCVQHRTGDEGYLNRSDISEDRVSISVQHNMPLECMWIIQVPENWKIQLQFLKFELVRPNDCDINFVDIYPERTDIPHQLAKYCGSRADSVTSDKNILNVRFVAEAAAVKSNFLALYTAFRDKPAQASCEPDEYDCEDATCISGKLRCNGIVNCRFRWDEDECPKSDNEAGMGSKHIIIIMVIFSLILCGMCTAFLFKCIRKLIQDHRTIKENIRESREFRLDELGRKSTKTPEDSRKHNKKRSPTPDPHASVIDHTNLADNINCYVPTDTLIPVSIRASEPMLANNNVGIYPNNPYPASIGNQTEEKADYDHNENDMEHFDTCDIACQTRESLFQPLQHNVSGSDDEPQFSTFRHKDKSKIQKSSKPRYMAEAVIEMESREGGTLCDNRRHQNTSHHREATRSAPDVIIMASSNTATCTGMSH